MRQLLIDTISGATRLALMEDGQLSDILIERADRPLLRGAIYKARVTHVAPSLSAAFLDIGGHSALLNYDGDKPVEGSDIIVQVAADAHTDKDARVTTRIQLTGRYAIWQPGGKGVTVSQKIRDKATRTRLADYVAKGLPGKVILRSNAASAPQATVVAEIDRLTTTWTAITNEVDTQDAPAQLLPPPSALQQAAIEWLTPQTTITTGDAALLKDITQTLAHWAPDITTKPHFDATPALFKHLGAQEEIEAALEPSVPLPGGGRLSIHETPALVAIDVDSGSAESWAPGTTSDAVNAQAAQTLVREIQKRHLGGIIAVDFIGFDDTLTKALAALREALQADPLSSKPTGVAGLGLALFTRQRLGPSLKDHMHGL